METFKIEIDRKEIMNIINNGVQEKVKSTMQTQMPDIQRALTEYFQKSFMSNKTNAFENALDWCVEAALREGLNKAMEELNFKEMIAEKAKEILSDNEFIKKLAEAKVRSSLGLPPL